jgi:hypothetical protein
MRFDVLAKVDQIVTKEVRLSVEASSEEEAQERATSALQTFPAAVEVPGILRIVANKATHWIPRSVDFVYIKKVNQSA